MKNLDFYHSSYFFKNLSSRLVHVVCQHVDGFSSLFFDRFHLQMSVSNE